jgi:hypothetical protein
MKRNKFNAKKTEVDGITFDSREEARRFTVLKESERCGEIHELTLQPSWVLQTGFRFCGKAVRPITYKADFMYRDGDTMVIEDVKGHRTPAYRIKAKLLKRLLADTNSKFVFREVMKACEYVGSRPRQAAVGDCEREEQ